LEKIRKQANFLNILRRSGINKKEAKERGERIERGVKKGNISIFPFF
jgi:hypothetical protein